MKYIGLVKWFDDTKGFGKIGTPDDGDIFIHQNNFVERPEKILQVTSLIFEIKKDNRGISATNVTAPNTYDDFKIILSYLKKNPTIPIEVTRKYKNKWGTIYSKSEVESYYLVGNSISQLLRKKQATEIFELFKRYFKKKLRNIYGNISRCHTNYILSFNAFIFFKVKEYFYIT